MIGSWSLGTDSQRLGHLWRRGRLWLLVVLLLTLWASDLPRVWRISNHHDLDVFLLAANRLRAGDDIYADTAAFQQSIESGTFSLKDDSVVWPYAYAPLIAMIFVPATYLPHALVAAVWWGINVASLLLGSWLCLRSMGPVEPLGLAVVFLLLYRFDPAVVTLRLGQIELLQYLLLAAVLHALARRRDRWAGLALGLATGLKFFPGALIVLLLWQRRWRAALWSVGTAALAIGGSFALVGSGALGKYWSFTTMYGIGGAFAAFPLNQSLNGFLSRNLMHNVFTPSLKGWHLPALAVGLTLLADAVIATVSARVTWPGSGGESRAGTMRLLALEYALAVAALTLISPHSQVYALIWLAVPLIALALWLLRQRHLFWGYWGGLIVAYVLVGRAYTFYCPGITRFVQAHYLFGTLLLWALLALVLWRSARPNGEGQLPAS